MTSPHHRPPDAAQEPAREAYHHGDLKNTLVSAAVALIEEAGVDNWSLRELARRAGVSSSAPFRHFADKTALLTAVAEYATQRLREAVERSLAEHAHEPPLRRFAAIGHPYLDWALRHPTHFRIVSERRWVDYDGSATLRADNEAIREHMRALLDEAMGASSTDTAETQLAGRALVYGLARMAVDGHFPEWQLGGGAAHDGMHATLERFIGLLQRPSAPLTEA